MFLVYNHSDMKKQLLTITNLNTYFKKDPNKRLVHKGLNISVNEGEVIAIIGRNGCGKTTLVNSILGVYKKARIQTGEIVFSDGFDTTKEIGIQFQTEDNVSELIRPDNLINFYKKYYGSRIDNEIVEEMIDIYGIRDFLKTKVSKLSGGQRQRLNLLLATMHKPKLLILDEFTTGLDVVSIMSILKYIKKLVKDINGTLILVTHQPKEIKLLAERVLFMNNGIIEKEFTIDEIEKKYKGDYDDFMFEVVSGEKYE